MPKSEIQKRLNSEYFQAIGRVAAEWALLERILITGISHIAFETPWHANVFTTNFNNINFLIKIFDSLLKTCGKRKSTISKYKKLRKAINDASAKRNTIVHGFWVGYAGQSERVGVINYRKNKRLTISIDPYTPEEIEVIADDIASVSKDLDGFMNRYILSIPSLCERHPPLGR
jgi:hypothetical protein